MSQITIDLPQEVFERLRAQAARSGKPIELVASDLLTAHLPQTQPSERERIREVLRTAGLLAELSPALKQRAAESTATLEEIQAAFARAGGKPLSEIVIEQRGLKE